MSSIFKPFELIAKTSSSLSFEASEYESMMKMSCHPRTKSMKNGCCHLLVRYCRLNERNSVDTLPLRGKGGRLSPRERRCRAARTRFTVSPERMNMHGRRGCMSIRVAQLTAVFSVSEQVAAGSFAILPAVLSHCGNCRWNREAYRPQLNESHCRHATAEQPESTKPSSGCSPLLTLGHDASTRVEVISHYSVTNLKITTQPMMLR